MSEFYDREGRPLELMEWAELNKSRAYSTLARTELGQLWVSTIWLGIDHGWNGGPPVIFESMVFGRLNYSELAMRRYATEADALAGHTELVAWALVRKHGLVKHHRDERRRRMKAHVALLRKADSGAVMDPMELAVLRMMKSR